MGLTEQIATSTDMSGICLTLQHKTTRLMWSRDNCITFEVCTLVPKTESRNTTLLYRLHHQITKQKTWHKTVFA